MTPELSQACARVKQILNLPPGPELEALIAAGNQATSVAELPGWAKAVLNADSQGAK